MNNMLGRTIQIFLPFGSPRGIKIAEITNRTVQAILIPRNELTNANVRDEIKSVGIYFLFGQSVEDGIPKVYIGEAENCFERLKQHNREKDFWEVAIVFVTNNQQNQFTKTDVKYLERLSFEKASNLKRYSLEQTLPAASFVPEWRTYDLLDIFDTMNILLSTLGYPIFENVRKVDTSAENLFYCKKKGVMATGEFTEEGFAVFKGSQISITTSFSIHNYILTKREALIKDQVVINNNGSFIFNKDYMFSSPSTAAGVVLGRNANGWIEWKNKNGQTLDFIKRQQG